MAESVKVIVRCRPMNNREKDMRCQGIVRMDSERCTCSIANPRDCSAPDKSFTFDGVYHTTATTEQVYNDIVYPLVEGVLEGYNSTVFAYGQTGCGKSFTMQGVTEPAAQRGIIPRAFEHIFEAISVAEGTKYLVHASYLEIYNEEIRDLLGKDAKKRLALKELADRGVYVQDLSQHPVQSVADCERLMQLGWRNRASGATLMNADSSRSHSIFSVSLEMMSSTFADEEDIRRGKLNLVDLAGSERQAKTGATGERLKEATKINLSLSALGNVISALVDGRSKHIPYRDSKLTRLLQDSLGGNTKTLMVGCVSPADNNYDETLSTLRYANRAKNICNKPVINQDPKDTMLQQYQEEIKKLKDLLQGQPITSASSPAGAELEREAVRLEFERKMAELRDEYAAEQDSKLRLQGDLDALRRRYEEEMTALAAGKQRETHKTPSELIVDQALHSESSGAQREVLARLQKLQETMVGGERADDRELKEKRMRKKKASERRLQALAKVLAKVDDDEGVVLQVYDDINQELSLKTDALRKNRQKLRALDREIVDLQSEFENERTDYLETIRRQERQLKLWQQIAEKIAPTLRREVNYNDLETVKASAVWSDDADRWTLPELTVARTKLPPAAVSGFPPPELRMPSSQTAPGRLEGIEPEETFDADDPQQFSDPKALIKVETDPSAGFPLVADHCLRFSPAGSSAIVALMPTSAHNKSHRSSGSSDKSSGSVGSSSSGRSPSPDEELQRRMLQRLQQSEREDIAGNYFKPKRATELLNRAKHDASNAFSTWKEFSSRNKSTGSTTSSTTNNALNSSMNQNGLHLSLNALNLNSSINGGVNGTGYQLANSWGNSINNNWPGGNHHNSSPETGMRRPIRLEALPTLDRKPVVNKRRGAKQELNTMDII